MSEPAHGGAPRAVVLVSGGLDSATLLAQAVREGRDCCALSFRYGQRHAGEIDSARAVAERLGVRRHLVLDLDLGSIGGSALTADIPVPKGRALETIGRDGIPVTYVPARNTVFLAVALAWAETLEAREIWIGVNALDHSGYPDCRPEFLEAFERLARVGTKAGVEGRAIRVRAPLVHLDKAGIIRLGTTLGVDYSLTRSCYDPDERGVACGLCDSCQLRRKGFREAGLADPVEYRAPSGSSDREPPAGSPGG